MVHSVVWYNLYGTIPTARLKKKEEKREGKDFLPSHLTYHTPSHLQFPVLLHHEKTLGPTNSDDAIKRTAAKLTTPRAIIIISTIILSGIRGVGCDPPTQEHDTYHNTHHPSSSSVDTRTKVNYYLMFSPSAYQAIQSKRLL